MSGLKGLFDGNREARLVQRGDSQKVNVRILRRHPPLKHHPTRALHCEQVAIPVGLRGVGSQGAVGAGSRTKFFEAGKESHGLHETHSSGSTTSQPSFK